MTEKAVHIRAAVGAPKVEPRVKSEDALALQFSELHKDDLRYVADWSKWLQWDGTRWAFDRTVNVYDLARAVCREGGARRAATRAAVENLARADRRHAATVEDWDSHVWLVTTPGGTVDLRTGDMKPNTPADLITKTTSISPKAGCDRWIEFLRRVTDGDDDLRAFLQRMAGYALTGLTREHALFFLYGLGANGKSVFLNTLSGIFGDYHVTAPMEVFIASHSDRHPTELAMLRGARLVTAVETEEGRRWAESRIKALTGGDPITARFMRQDFFEFIPVFKLMIAGNHKPALRSVDEAIRRRLHLVPFTVTIPESQRDETLAESLKGEWPGILEWAIEGAVEWGMTGLRSPEAVREATKEYLTAEDALAQWIGDRCSTGPDFRCSTSDLFASWRSWCEDTGEFVGSMKRLSQKLEAHEYARIRIGGTGRNGFAGLAPKSEM